MLLKPLHFKVKHMFPYRVDDFGGALVINVCTTYGELDTKFLTKISGKWDKTKIPYNKYEQRSGQVKFIYIKKNLWVANLYIRGLLKKGDYYVKTYSRIRYAILKVGLWLRRWKGYSVHIYKEAFPGYDFDEILVFVKKFLGAFRVFIYER